MELPLLKRPSASLPILTSLCALAMIAGYLVTYAAMGQELINGADEATPARVFQLMMLIQLPMAAYFAWRWFPRQPRQAAVVLGLQATAWLVPIATIIYLER